MTVKKRFNEPQLPPGNSRQSRQEQVTQQRENEFVFHGNFMAIQPTVLQVFHAQTTNVNLMVVLHAKSGNHQSQQTSSSGDNECLYKIS